MPRVGQCQWCGATAALVKSHIIPKSFYRKVRGDGKYSLMVAANPAIQNEQWQNGVYDNFLCLPCEKRFCPWDEHGFAILSKDPEGLRLIRDKESGYPLGYELEGASSVLLKRFFLSVLWRAGACKHPFFKAVKLGPYRKQIKAALSDNSNKLLENYKTIVISVSGQRIPDIIYIPFTKIIDDVYAANLWLPNIKIIIKLEKRNWDSNLEACVFDRTQPPVMIRLPFDSLYEQESFNQAIRVARAKSGKPT
jgi:hypothetical protein